MLRHTNRQQDNVIGQAEGLEVDNIITQLIEIIEDLDSQLDEAISERDEAKQELERLEGGN